MQILLYILIGCIRIPEATEVLSSVNKSSCEVVISVLSPAARTVDGVSVDVVERIESVTDKRF